MQREKIMANTNNNSTWNDTIYAFYGSTSFCKIKNTALQIGKVLFSFVTTDKDGKAIKDKSVDIYLEIPNALVLARDIIQGNVAKRREVEKAKGEQYPKAIWQSTLGGKHEEAAGRSDGKAISRYFEITPASKGIYCFAAKSGPGKTNENGLIVPDGKPDVTIYVPVPSEAEMQNFAEAMMAELYAFKTAVYSKAFPWKVNKQEPAEMKPENAAAPEIASKQEDDQEVPKEKVSDYAILSPYTEVQPMKNGVDFCMQAMTKDNQIIVLIFPKKEIDKIEAEKWKQFTDLTKVKGKKFAIDYTLVKSNEKEYYYFSGFHKG